MIKKINTNMSRMTEFYVSLCCIDDNEIKYDNYLYFVKGIDEDIHTRRKMLINEIKKGYKINLQKGKKEIEAVYSKHLEKYVVNKNAIIYEADSLEDYYTLGWNMVYIEKKDDIN